MKKILLLLLLVPFATICNAQSKIFTEISEDISSEMKVILEDNELVGYLVFTRLEMATEDSFNYTISLMDENLNEIGKVNFREEDLNLEAVSFEQDVLCIAYFKSNIVGKKFKNRKSYANYDAKSSIFTQFITLTGKVIKTNTTQVTLFSKKDYDSPVEGWDRKFTFKGGLSHGIQIKNLSGVGFACFYGDKNERKLVAYDLSGNLIWEKSIWDGVAFNLLSSNTTISILQLTFSPQTGPKYYVISFNGKDGSEYYEDGLIDPSWNRMGVFTWDVDPITGNPFLCGNIGNPDDKNYKGIYVIELTGPSKKEIKKTFIYLNSKFKNMADSANSYMHEINSKVHPITSFRDFSGNTIFILDVKGSKGSNITLLKTNSKGVLSNESIANLSKDWNYYCIDNYETKDNCIVADSPRDILIYSFKKGEIVRTIPKKEGKSHIKVFPAKNGHIMVVETNKKEKYTRLSIETLN